MRKRPQIWCTWKCETPNYSTSKEATPNPNYFKGWNRKPEILQSMKPQANAPKPQVFENVRANPQFFKSVKSKTQIFKSVKSQTQIFKSVKRQTLNIILQSMKPQTRSTLKCESPNRKYFIPWNPKPQVFQSVKLKPQVFQIVKAQTPNI